MPRTDAQWYASTDFSGKHVRTRPCSVELMRMPWPRLHVNGTTILKARSTHLPAARQAAPPRSRSRGDGGVLVLVPRPGKAATGLERRVIRQGLGATPGRGGKVVTAILSAAYNLRLQTGKKPRKTIIKPETEHTVPAGPRPVLGAPAVQLCAESTPHQHRSAIKRNKSPTRATGWQYLQGFMQCKKSKSSKPPRFQS